MQYPLRGQLLYLPKKLMHEIDNLTFEWSKSGKRNRRKFEDWPFLSFSRFYFRNKKKNLQQ